MQGKIAYLSWGVTNGVITHQKWLFCYSWKVENEIDEDGDRANFESCDEWNESDRSNTAACPFFTKEGIFRKSITHHKSYPNIIYCWWKSKMDIHCIALHKTKELCDLWYCIISPIQSNSKSLPNVEILNHRNTKWTIIEYHCKCDDCQSHIAWPLWGHYPIRN